MGQVSSFITRVPITGRQDWYATNLTLSVANSTTVILTVPCVEISKLFVQLSVATNALSAFLIEGRCHVSASYVTLYNTAGSFTTPTGLMIGASGDLTTLAAAASGWFMLDVTGLEHVQVSATSGNAGGSTLQVYAGGQ